MFEMELLAVSFSIFVTFATIGETRVYSSDFERIYRRLLSEIPNYF